MKKNRTLIDKIKGLGILDSFKIVWFLMIFVVIYYVFIVVDRYVSLTNLSARSTSGESIQAGRILSLLSTTSNNNEDMKYLRSCIHFLDLLKRLKESIKLRKLYQERFVDLPYRIFDSSSNESYLKFFKSHVKLKVDDETGLLDIEIEAFTPKPAQIITQSIVEESEKFTNETSHKAAGEQMRLTKEEVNTYKEGYLKAQNAFIAFQNKYDVFDLLKQAGSKSKLITQTEINLIQKEAALLNLQSYMNDSAPEVVALKAEIGAIKRQLERKMAKISVNNPNTQRLSDMAVKFQNLTIETRFAQQACETALEAYESARVEAAGKIKQLVIVQSPNLPESARYPERLYGILTAFLILSLVFGITKFVGMIIEEHRY